MKEKITPYLKQLCGSKAISGQYRACEDEPEGGFRYSDPLQEEAHEVVKGLIHKYDNRALIKVSYQCAAHCRFCTRIRQIGNAEGMLGDDDIAQIIRYLLAHSEIDDVILSGGDPFYTAKLTIRLLDELRNIDSVKVMRIGTRLPLQLPGAFKTEAIQQLLEVIEDIGREKPFYILLHVNHPDELTEDAIGVIALLRRKNVTLSQTVFLNGINDSFSVLHLLYTRLYHAGVIPYYLYHCDAVEGIQHFAVSIEKEREIATRLRASLSGIACPTYVVDVENGYGKIPVPLNFFDGDVITDFHNKTHGVARTGNECYIRHRQSSISRLPSLLK